MTPEAQETYYDLHLTGIGYLNPAREIPVRQGKALLAVDITALQGRADRIRKTRFDCNARMLSNSSMYFLPLLSPIRRHNVMN